MKVIYRISDGGNKRDKPYYVNAKTIFSHFLKVFYLHEIYVIADNVSDDTYRFLSSKIDQARIIRTKLSNAGALMFAIDYAIQNFQDSDAVYFAEDDYAYTKNAPGIIEEGLSLAQYSSGYDHPDKYINHNEGGPNPHISQGGELTRVLISKSCHWKLTNSCCMTFATTVRILKEDLEIIRKHCQSSPPADYRMFQELISRGRKLVSPLPSVSTHGENRWLAKFVDWEKEVINYQE
uniref:Glycosyltransferase n=1 Tax=viral metagenome TaxID=1070528 RepID=A0A6C0ANI4_9ZZZZ